MRYIAVIDCNNFFVSCERLFRPDLERTPVVVLSSNDGCVVARSQEIKDNGIPMGVPYFQIKDILKDIGAVSFSSHFALYRDISSRVFSVVKNYCGTIEQYSIDEAFFAYEADSDELARSYVGELKTRVERSVGIPVSIGVSDTKTRAKLVSGYAKKHGGIAVIGNNLFLEQFGQVSLSEVWGVGRKLSERYRTAGLSTINELVVTPQARVAAIAHSHGVALQSELQGSVVYRVEQSTPLPQSIMSTRSFGKKTNDIAVLKDALAHHIRSVFEELREKKLLATGMRVLLETGRHSDWRFQGGRKDIFFESPTAQTKIGLGVAITLLESLYKTGVPYNKTGVVLYGLMPEDFFTEGLFSQVINGGSKIAVDGIVDKLNARYGRDTLRQGVFTKGSLWQAKGERRSPAYTTDWQAIKIVSA